MNRPSPYLSARENLIAEHARNTATSARRNVWASAYAEEVPSVLESLARERRTIENAIDLVDAGGEPASVLAAVREMLAVRTAAPYRGDAKEPKHG